VVLGLSACSLSPEPLTLDQQITQAAADRAAMFAAQQALSGPVTLEEAMARAVKYNLQHRLTLMERALQENLLGVSKNDLLPKLSARAGVRTRSNLQASVSESVETGRVSLEPSTSSDRQSANAELQLSYNILDFGLSYYNAKAQANRVLAAEERRRRAVLAIMEQVRAAWWEAVTAERLRDQVAAVLAETRQALSQAEQTEQQRLVPPLESLRYQKALLEVVQQLEAVEAELAMAKAQLAALMNLPPATSFTLAVPAEASLTRPALALKLEQLEAVAMVERPEIREEAYLARNAALETRSSLLRLLPGANLYGGVNWDSNSYLVNQNWADAGVQVTWNLFNLLSVGDIVEAGEARARVAETRRLALRMAVLTQVNLAWRRYERASMLFERARSLQAVERRIYDQTARAEASDAQTRLERIRAGAAAVLATRARDRAYAELQNALGSIYQAAGLDPLPGELPADDIASLAQAIAAMTRRMETGDIPVPVIPAAPAQISGLPVAAGTLDTSGRPVTVAEAH